MQLGQAQALGVLDDHQRRIRHVHAHLDHRGGDQQVGVTLLEGAHRGLFLGRLHAPVHQPDTQARQLRRQRFEGGLRGGGDHLVALVDQRAHPIGLASFRAGHADALDQLGAPLGTDHDGLHRRAPGRQFVDRRHVQVCIGGHRQRARDRRGGHHQLMRHAARRRALVAQCQPLVHAEAVLFVDDGQRQVMEHHRLLHQRMRAHHHLRVAGGDLGQHALARLAGDLAGQPGDADAKRLQPAAQVVQMLLGEQFGRRRQRGLLALLHRQHRGQRRHHGLAAADITLHQPQHRRRPRQILPDLREHALLRAGQGERQRGEQAFDLHALAGQRRCAVLLQRDALATQAQVMGEQFLHRQPLLRGMAAGGERRQVALGRGPVHVQQRLPQRRQLLAFEPVGRQQFELGLRRQAVQRLPDEATQRYRPDALHRRIHRIQRIAEDTGLLLVDHPVTGVDHLPAVLAGLGRAIGAHARTDRELGDLRGAEMEEAQHHAAVRFIAERHPQHRPVAEAALDGFDASFDLRGHAVLQLGDVGEAGAVLVAQRQQQPEVLQGKDAARSQLRRDRLPDTGQAGQRRVAGPCQARRGRARARHGTVSRAPSPRRPRSRRPSAGRRLRWWNGRGTGPGSIPASPR